MIDDLDHQIENMVSLLAGINSRMTVSTLIRPGMLQGLGRGSILLAGAIAHQVTQI